MNKSTKRVLVILAFVAGLSYFAFTLVFFDPFEGSYMDSYEDTPIAIEYAIPTTVDFFAHKRALERDITEDQFPVPAAWDDITLSKNWQAFERGPLYAKLKAEHSPSEKIEEIRAITRQIPLLEPITDVLGRDAAVFGRFAGRGSDKNELATVFLGSRSARFAYEAIGLGWMRALLGIPVEVEIDPFGVRTLRLEDGTEIHAYRHLDLFVVGTGAQLVSDVVTVLDGGRQQSLGYLRRYHATVAQDVKEFAGLAETRVTTTKEVERRIQFYGRMPALFSQTTWDETLLDPGGSMARWLFARVLNPSYFGDIVIDLGLGELVDLRGMLSFSRERAEQAQTGFYNRRTFELKKAMDNAARLLPADTYFLIAARLDMNRFLPTMVNALTDVDPATRTLLDELIQSIRRWRPDFRPTNSVEMVKTIASFIGDDIVIALKRDNYFGAPKDGVPVVTLFLQVTDRGPSKEVLDKAVGDPKVAHGYNAFLNPITAISTRLGSEGKGLEKWWIVTHEKNDPGNERIIQDLWLKGTSVDNIAFGIIDPNSKEKGPWTLAFVMSPQLVTRPVAGGEPSKFGSAHEMMTDIVKMSVNDGKPGRTTDNNLGGTRIVQSLYMSEKYQAGSDFLDGFASVAMFVDADGIKQLLIDQASAEATDDEIVARSASAQRMREAELEWISFIKTAFLAARIDEDSQNIELRARVKTRLQ